MPAFGSNIETGELQSCRERWSTNIKEWSRVCFPVDRSILDFSR